MQLILETFANICCLTAFFVGVDIFVIAANMEVKTKEKKGGVKVSIFRFRILWSCSIDIWLVFNYIYLFEECDESWRFLKDDTINRERKRDTQPKK